MSRVRSRRRDPVASSIERKRSAGFSASTDAKNFPITANKLLGDIDVAPVTFRWKDYRADGRDRQKVMTLATGEFIRRFLIHVLPHGFHRHYGLFASGTRVDNIARARRLLDASMAQSRTADTTSSGEPKPLSHPCPCCGGRMVIIEVFERGATPRHRPTAPPIAIRVDTS